MRGDQLWKVVWQGVPKAELQSASSGVGIPRGAGGAATMVRTWHDQLLNKDQY